MVSVLCGEDRMQLAARLPVCAGATGEHTLAGWHLARNISGADAVPERKAVCERGCERGARVAINIHKVSIGKWERHHFCLAFAKASEVVGRPYIRARVTHHPADEFVGGGRLDGREKALGEIRGICTSASEAGSAHRVTTAPSPWRVAVLWAVGRRTLAARRAAYSRCLCAQPSGRRNATPPY